MTNPSHHEASCLLFLFLHISSNLLTKLIFTLLQSGCPPFKKRITNIRTLDLSNNQLSSLNPSISNLTQLKSLNLENNKLIPGSVTALSQLTNLQTLSLGNNMLGRPVSHQNTNPAANVGKKIVGHLPHPNTTNPIRTASKNHDPLPSALPSKLKSLKMNANYLSNVPKPIFQLHKLDKLDLSNNQLASLPVELGPNLTNLTELILDDNSIVSLPESIGKLVKLKVLSLKRNHISASNTQWSDTTNPQPLPASLFTDTPLIDLNLHENPMTSTQLNSMDGYSQFLERRKTVKTNALLGGALTNLDVCGLE